MLHKLFWTISATFALFLGSQLPWFQHAAILPNPTALAAEVKQVENISDQELEKFADAWISVVNIERDTRQEIVEIVQDAGFEPQRFGDIAEAYQSQTEPTPPLTSEEETSFEQAAQQIQSLRENTRNEMQQAVRSQGLDPQRFSELLTAVREDQALQEEVKNMIQDRIPETPEN
ncbi:DUF4168 domain-containing protein [Spirulina sp. CS-785/01]|uniref:DUF4168 domain-containing protein n=1 Tax=Spirulina sp. CS-785/01 TaxID=3021716 RepID=UPI00232C241D|nr:DUF4168 domain-containing protein [Spirulina sp. CS-785/01]MDB9312806.1 DUF4168 domain-containing protein [Spirulina sp. CS-785/01]